jgi:hypothetical protein
MKKLFIIFIITVLSFYSSAQEFPINTYGKQGTERGVGISLTTDDKGYIMAGFTTSFNASGEDIYVVKTDLKGNLIW